MPFLVKRGRRQVTRKENHGGKETRRTAFTAAPHCELIAPSSPRRQVGQGEDLVLSSLAFLASWGTWRVPATTERGNAEASSWPSYLRASVVESPLMA